MARRIERFQDRDPVVIGAIALTVMGLLLVAGWRAGDLPLVGGGDTYFAEFSESGGLKVNDPVQVAGVRVGAVTAIELDGNKVRIGFEADTAVPLGDLTRAEIRVRTLLGAMLLAIEPDGSGDLESGSVIPLARTTAPFEIVAAVGRLGEQAEAIDVDQLGTSLTALADLTRNTPEELRGALDGVSRLSRIIASRDEELESLLGNLERVSRVLDDRDQDVVALMDDAGQVFEALVLRKAAIHRVLVSTTALGKELSTLIRRSRADLKPALAHLDLVLDVLLKNEDNLESAINTLAPFVRSFAAVAGNGPWLDGYIFNLPPLPGTP